MLGLVAENPPQAQDPKQKDQPPSPVELELQKRAKVNQQNQRGVKQKRPGKDGDKGGGAHGEVEGWSGGVLKPETWNMELFLPVIFPAGGLGECGVILGGGLRGLDGGLGEAFGLETGPAALLQRGGGEGLGLAAGAFAQGDSGGVFFGGGGHTGKVGKSET